MLSCEEKRLVQSADEHR